MEQVLQKIAEAEQKAREIIAHAHLQAEDMLRDCEIKKRAYKEEMKEQMQKQILIRQEEVLLAAYQQKEQMVVDARAEGRLLKEQCRGLKEEIANKLLKDILMMDKE